MVLGSLYSIEERREALDRRRAAERICGLLDGLGEQLLGAKEPARARRLAGRYEQGVSWLERSESHEADDLPWLYARVAEGYRILIDAYKEMHRPQVEDSLPARATLAAVALP